MLFLFCFSWGRLINFIFNIDEFYLLRFLGNLGDCVRYRCSGMGRFIGGGYDLGVVFVCGLSSRLELFGVDVNDLFCRRGLMDEVGR